MKSPIIAIALLLCTVSKIHAIELALSESEKREILEQSLQTISESYVDVDMRQQIVADIWQRNAQNPYYLLDAGLFIETLTDDLREVSGDGHLYLRVGGQKKRRMASLPGTGEDYLNAEILPDNIGYLDVRIFGMQDKSLNEIDAAMALVKETKALVIDLRRCRGGAVQGVEQLLNYFATSSKHYLTSINTYQGWTKERFTQPDAAKYHYDKPLFILLGDRTFSAAEDFAYSIELLGLGKLIGQTTKGGGYMNMMVPVHEEIILSVSIGKTFNPDSGVGWQGTGIKPEIEVPEDEALNTALALISLE